MPKSGRAAKGAARVRRDAKRLLSLEERLRSARGAWRKGFYRNLIRATNLAERTLLGPLTPAVSTPYRVVFRWEVSTLNRYFGARSPRRRVPILIIPPLMVRPTVFDLWVGHSFVGNLVEEGFDVFLVDFGIPRREDRGFNIDRYITEFIREAHLQVLKASGAPSATLLGWSMGGIMSCLYSAYWAPDARVANMVVLGSPIDFSQQFPFHQIARLAGTPVMALIDAMGNVPAILIRNAFKAMAPVRRWTRYLDLWRHYDDRQYIGVFESLEEWVDNFIPYPADAFKQFVDEYFRKDKLRRGELAMGDRRIDLKAITCPILILIGLSDSLARPAAVRALKDLVSSRRVDILEVPFGHIGLMA